MDALEEKLLARLVFAPEKLSRNKNFAMFQRPEYRRVRRRAAHLRSLLDLLERADPNDVRIALCGEREEIEVRVDELRSGGTRLSYVPVAEYLVLLRHAATRRLLRELHDAPLPSELLAS